MLEEMAQLSREEPKITRVGSMRKKASSVPATPSTPIVNELVSFQDGSKLICNSRGVVQNLLTTRTLQSLPACEKP